MENEKLRQQKARKYAILSVENTVDMCGNIKNTVENRVDNVKTDFKPSNLNEKRI